MERVTDVMTAVVDTATPADSLTRVAHVMWERDCGVVPVLDADGRPLGMITDRDTCMAAFMRGRPLHEIAVSDVLSDRAPVTVLGDATLDVAHDLMRTHQVRRLPVVDAAGVCIGVVSLADLVQVSGGRASDAERRQRAEAAGTTLAAVVRPHATNAGAALAAPTVAQHEPAAGAQPVASSKPVASARPAATSPAAGASGRTSDKASGAAKGGGKAKGAGTGRRKGGAGKGGSASAG